MIAIIWKVRLRLEAKGAKHCWALQGEGVQDGNLYRRGAAFAVPICFTGVIPILVPAAVHRFGLDPGHQRDALLP